MRTAIRNEQYDVVVVGGGCAGVAAAIAAARNGARTLLVDAGPGIGGELVSGIPVDGALNARGEWVCAGIMKELFDECERLGGYIGPVKDWRLIWYVCLDPEIMKIAVMNLCRKAGVQLLLYTFADEVVVSEGRMRGVVVLNKNQRTLVTARYFIDCSGDGDMAIRAGAPFEVSNELGEFQPLTLMFRMVNVDWERALRFVADHPENVALGESEFMGQGRPDKELAMELYRQGLPGIFFKGNGPLIADGIAAGEMFPTALIGVVPVSRQRREVGLNTTRLANIDATDTRALSAAVGELMDQVWQCSEFMRKRVPGFEDAHFSGLAPRVGIRETRRIVGEYVLTGEDVLEGRKFPDAIAKGSHHVDIHQDGIKQVRIPVKNGGSYDVPYPTLIPRNLRNVFVAGRCMSATREGHGSARVMATCMAMGQAAGTAAAHAADLGGAEDFRNIDVQALRGHLRRQGAILEGVY